MSYYKIVNNVLILNLQIQPNAKENKIFGVINDHLKVKINAPANEGKANEMIELFFAEVFNVSKKNVILQKGIKSKYKKIQIIFSESSNILELLNKYVCF